MKDIKALRIVLVGAGNLATQLGAAFVKQGVTIVQVYSKTEANARTLAEKLGCDYTAELSKIQCNADIYIYAVKDAVLSDLVGVIDAPKAWHLHTAGSVSMDVFSGKRERYGVFYPLQTFSKSREVTFDTIPICIEAVNDEGLELLHALGSSISENVYEVNSAQRSKLHLAAVFTCNFTNRMYAIAHDIVRENDLPFDLLLPLIEETARKVQTMLPADAQTGPAIRYDRNVIEKHVEMLADDRLKDLYRLISENIHEAYFIKKQNTNN